MVEKLTTGFEERELLNIECSFCHGSGAINDGTKWVDCPKCIHARIEARSRLHSLTPKVEKENKRTIMATESGPVELIGSNEPLEPVESLVSEQINKKSRRGRK